MQVLQALEKALAKDHARNQITEVSRLGLVEMTRKRTRESLEHLLCRACPTCGGLGMRTRIDPGRVVPDKSKTLREGAILAWERARLAG